MKWIQWLAEKASAAQNPATAREWPGRICLASAGLILGCLFFPVVFRLLLIPLIVLFAASLFILLFRLFTNEN